MHPRRLRCSSLKYSRYSRSSRLAGGAPRPSRCDARLSPRAVKGGRCRIASRVEFHYANGMHPLATSAPINTSTLDRDALIAWYRRNRERSRAIFDRLADEAYYAQPIALRHPIVFYEGHLPAFSFNTLVKRALGGASIDARLESLFARGIDPSDETAADTLPEIQWQTRDAARVFASAADRRVLDALANADLERPGHPLLDRAEAVFTILEHEAMHQETLLYMWHRLPFDQKRTPAGYRPRVEGAPPRREWIEIPRGKATLGVERGSIPFGWDNECPALSAEVPAFAIERHDGTNEQ